jgi:hypothetical protein
MYCGSHVESNNNNSGKAKSDTGGLRHPMRAPYL